MFIFSKKTVFYNKSYVLFCYHDVLVTVIYFLQHLGGKLKFGRLINHFLDTKNKFEFRFIAGLPQSLQYCKILVELVGRTSAFKICQHFIYDNQEAFVWKFFFKF